MQFLDKQDEANLRVLEPDDSTIEQILESEDITVNHLPEERAEEPFISVKQKVFDKGDISKFDHFSNQEIEVINDTYLISTFKKPLALPKKASPEMLEGFVRNTFAYPDDYVLWDWNKELNVLVFFQQENDRPVYFNQNGMILVFLNDDDEVIFYTQTMLEEAESLQDKRELMKPIQAIETLYNANELRSGDEVTAMDIGFHTRTPSERGVQVFVPTWKITVNENQNYFINAIEGWIFLSNELDFLAETIENSIERMKLEENDEREEINMIILQEKLEQLIEVE